MEELAPLALEFEPRLEGAILRWTQLTPWQRRFVTLEDLAVDTGLKPGEFLAAIVRASFEFTDRIADLIVAAAFPEIVLASAKRALTPDGFADRKLLLEHMWSWQDPRLAVQSDEKSFDAVINAGPTDDPPPAA